MSFLRTYMYLATGYSLLTFNFYNHNAYQYEEYAKEELELGGYYFSIVYYCNTKETNIIRSILRGMVFPSDITWLTFYYLTNGNKINNRYNITLKDIMFMHNPYFYFIKDGQMYEHHVRYEQYINKVFLTYNQNNDLL